MEYASEYWSKQITQLGKGPEKNAHLYVCITYIHLNIHVLLSLSLFASFSFSLSLHICVHSYIYIFIYCKFDSLKSFLELLLPAP